MVVKISLSAGAIYFVLTRLDLTQIAGTIRESNGWWLCAALLTYVFSQIVSALRLNALFSTIPLRVPMKANLRLYWLGMFYNFFLPGGVGGDGYKVYFIRKYFLAPVKQVLMAILADRLSGLSVILVYLLGLVYFIEYSFPYQGYLFLAIPMVSAGYFLFLYVLARYLTGAFVKVTLYSLVVQGLQMAAAMLILLSMGAMVKGHTDDYLFLFLLSSIASAVPVTLGGIGARELTFLVGSKYLGTSQEHAVALSLLFYLLSLIGSLPGLLYVIYPHKMMQGIEVKQLEAVESEI